MVLVTVYTCYRFGSCKQLVSLQRGFEIRFNVAGVPSSSWFTWLEQQVRPRNNLLILTPMLCIITFFRRLPTTITANTKTHSKLNTLWQHRSFSFLPWWAAALPISRLQITAKDVLLEVWNNFVHCLFWTLSYLSIKSWLVSVDKNLFISLSAAYWNC